VTIQPCTLCHGTGRTDDGQPCPYTDVHRAAARFPRAPPALPPTPEPKASCLEPLTRN